MTLPWQMTLFNKRGVTCIHIWATTRATMQFSFDDGLFFAKHNGFILTLREEFEILCIFDKIGQVCSRFSFQSFSVKIDLFFDTFLLQRRWKSLVKTQVHKNKNIPSEMISYNCILDFCTFFFLDRFCSKAHTSNPLWRAKLLLKSTYSLSTFFAH